MCIRIRILHSTFFFSPPFLVKETKSFCELLKEIKILEIMVPIYILSSFPQLRENSVVAKLHSGGTQYSKTSDSTNFFSPDSTFVLLQASLRTIVSQVHKSFC